MFAAVASQHGLPLANGASKNPLPPIQGNGKQIQAVSVHNNPYLMDEMKGSDLHPMVDLEDDDLPPDVQTVSILSFLRSHHSSFFHALTEHLTVRSEEEHDR